MGPHSAFRWCVTALCLSLALPGVQVLQGDGPRGAQRHGVRVPEPAAPRRPRRRGSRRVARLQADRRQDGDGRADGDLPGLGRRHARLPDAAGRGEARAVGGTGRSGVRARGGRPRAGAGASRRRRSRVGRPRARARSSPAKPVVPSWAKPSLAKAKPPGRRRRRPPEVKPCPPPPRPSGAEPDYRLLVGVSWGGIDTREQGPHRRAAALRAALARRRRAARRQRADRRRATAASARASRGS